MTRVDPETTGRIGLEAHSPRLYWPFREPSAAIPPSDKTGHTDDLRALDGQAAPDIAEGVTGHARVFGGGEVLVGESIDSRGALDRDLTVLAWVRWDAAEQTGDGALIGYWLVGQEISASWAVVFDAETERVRLTWTTEPGVLVETVGAPVQPGEWTLVGFTRHWQPGTSGNPGKPGGAEVACIIDGQLVATERVTAQVEAPAHGQIILGARPMSPGSGGSGGGPGSGSPGDDPGDAAAGFTDHWRGLVDSIAVFDRVLAVEEIAAERASLTRWQPMGQRILRACLPPGIAYSQDPDSIVQRTLAAEGDSLGLILATLDRLAVSALPDSATKRAPERAAARGLARLEALLGLAAGPFDSIATRRQRIIAAFSQDRGMSTGAIKAVLAPLLHVEPDELTVHLGSPRIDPADRLLWTHHGAGTVTAEPGTVQITAPAGDPWPANGFPQYRTVISGQAVMEATLTEILGDAGLRTGIAVWNSRLESVGVMIDRDGRAFTLDGSWIGSFAVPVRLRLELDPAGDLLATLGAIRVLLGPAPEEPRSSGVFALEIAPGLALTGAPALPVAISWSDLVAWDPARKSMLHAFIEYPARLVTGAADGEGARAQLQRQKPAHVLAAVITRSVLETEDPRSGAGVGRLGRLDAARTPRTRAVDSAGKRFTARTTCDEDDICP